MSDSLSNYIREIKQTATSIFEGMSVTMSYMFRRPVTIQYPDRLPRPVHEMLPPRYRGFLEVDMDICTACLACERACPIDCIKIDAKKDKETRRLVMSRFDIDLAKCMFCGLCSEPCPTSAIAHTPHFEASTAYVENLTFRFVPQDAFVQAFKAIKGYDAPRQRRGAVLERNGWVYRGARERAFKPPPLDLPRLAPPKVATTKKAAEFVMPTDRISKFAPQVVGVDQKKLAVILEQAMAGTDCGACDWPTCKEYAVALAFGKDTNPHKCAPGGLDSQYEADVILRSWKAGKVVPEALGQAPSPEQQAEAAAGSTQDPNAPKAPGIDPTAPKTDQPTT